MILYVCTRAELDFIYFKHSDLLMGYIFAIYETVRLDRGDWHIHTAPEKDHLDAFLMTLFTFQVSESDGVTLL